MTDDSDPGRAPIDDSDDAQPSIGRLVLVTGAQAVGKTTVARTLARRLTRAVHIDGDAIADMVVSGAVGMDLPPARDGVEQLYLRWTGALALAENYQRAGFDAVISDNVFGEFFADFVDFVAPEPLHVIMLRAGAASLRARESGRDKVGYTDTVTIDALIGGVDATPRVGLWLDTTGLSVEVTVEEIVDRLDEARIDTTSELA